MRACVGTRLPLLGQDTLHPTPSPSRGLRRLLTIHAELSPHLPPTSSTDGGCGDVSPGRRAFVAAGAFYLEE